MINDLDETIKQLLIQKVPKVPIDIAGADIDFNRPSQNWETRLSKLTVNCFLYDIHENLSLRCDRQQYLTRNNGNTSGTESLAPVRIDFTYLITVWAVSDEATRVSQEHMLLGSILQTLLQYPTLPTTILQGQLQNQPYPLRTWVAQPEDTPKTWEFWGSNEWRLKPGISYRATLAVQPVSTDVGKLVTEVVIDLQEKRSQ